MRHAVTRIDIGVGHGIGLHEGGDQGTAVLVVELGGELTDARQHDGRGQRIGNLTNDGAGSRRTRSNLDAGAGERLGAEQARVGAAGDSPSGEVILFKPAVAEDGECRGGRQDKAERQHAGKDAPIRDARERAERFAVQGKHGDPLEVVVVTRVARRLATS